MDDYNCCGKINSNLLTEGMTATAPWKASNINGKIDPTISGIKPEKRKMFIFRNNYYLDQHNFLQPAISLSFFCTPVNNFRDMLFQREKCFFRNNYYLDQHSIL